MNTFPTVEHVTLHLAVDTSAQRLYGHADLKASCPLSATSVGLHAYQLAVRRVTVDGAEASFQLRPAIVESLPEALLRDDSGAAAAVAEHAFYQYERALQREADPELLVALPPAAPGRQPDAETQGPPAAALDAGKPLAAAAGAENARALALCVEYEAGASGSGLCCWDGYARAGGEPRRACAWFPCVDTPSAASTYEVFVTVGAGELAAAPGRLVCQSRGADGRRTFRFHLASPAPPAHLALAVGPFAVVPGVPASETMSGLHDGGEGGATAGAGGTTVTHLGPPALASELAHGAAFLPLAFGLYETFLGCSFPFSAFHAVFVPSGAALAGVQAAAGMQIASADLLYSGRAVEAAVEARLAGARALARQWFGMWLRPATPADAWLLEGLAGYLEDLFVRRFMGRNELAYRRAKEREAIYLADDGAAPPLYVRGPAYPWGALHATEELGPGGALRAWKAAAVVGMLERRVGEDTFKRLLERHVVASCAAPGKGGAPAGARLLGTREFLNEVGKAGGFKRDVAAFHERWVAGRGCPRLTAGFVYHRKRAALELAVRQTGSAAARAAAERAAAAASKEGSSVGILKVLVHEADGPVEHPVNVGAAALTLVELRVASKPGAKKPGRKKRAEAADGEEGADDAPAEDDGAAQREPVQWVRLDPHGESLAPAAVLQPEAMWAAQLERSRDVVAQSAAVAGLAALRPITYGVVNALRACAGNAVVYCRVRVEALMALGRTAGADTHWAGSDALLKMLRARALDPDTGQPRPRHFASLAEFFVDQALPLAVAAVRDARGVSPVEAAELLLDIAGGVDNRGNPYDDASLTAALVEALGRLRLRSPELLARVVAELDRSLAREAVAPSYQHAVGCAALCALQRLTASLPNPAAMSCRLQALFAQYLRQSVPERLRRTAAACTLQLAAASGGVDAALAQALAVIGAEHSQAVRQGVLEDLLPLLRAAPRPQALAALHALLAASGDVRLRHLAFVALMRLGGEPATLYRDRSEDELAGGGGAAASMETGAQRQVPAQSGPAHSLDSAGRRAPVIKLRPGLAGVSSRMRSGSPRQAASGGTWGAASGPSAGGGGAVAADAPVVGEVASASPQRPKTGQPQRGGDAGVGRGGRGGSRQASPAPRAPAAPRAATPEMEREAVLRDVMAIAAGVLPAGSAPAPPLASLASGGMGWAMSLLPVIQAEVPPPQPQPQPQPLPAKLVGPPAAKKRKTAEAAGAAGARGLAAGGRALAVSGSGSGSGDGRRRTGEGEAERAERAERKRAKKKEKEARKAVETPEERAARRALKKAKKESSGG
ncbi:hypothetical protein WJX81_006717 [Elliptochloris bilobata]|uniref:Transcription initiation factor TFIID subunit 2 n=1 Tax=Elliptochloris bilobata TaxID=381761 RepID=A0AAW1QV12_9CHLO